MTTEHHRLDKRIQKWLFEQGWTELKAIQKSAITAVLACDRDIIISAPTASGKTEAFFLPALSFIGTDQAGFGILYISPLKALINDQYRRLEPLAEALNIEITPWHGDSLYSKKNKIKNKPSGVLLITPESLEALLIRNPIWVKQHFAALKYVVIDEFHTFIGTERGQQLLSLLTRIEHMTNRAEKPVPRVALSATLGELEKIPPLLRPNKSLPCEIINHEKQQSTVKVQVKGYIEPPPASEKLLSSPAERKICHDIFNLCRGSSHLVFANSRTKTESISACLDDLSKQHFVPNEFFPHHGSLAKAEREALEARLQKEEIPTTAICTTTLELGIDIGKVNSVVQVAAPYSVSSLRQRIGRSGRRNNPSILRMLITEKQVTVQSNIIDRLRLELIQALAMLRLLILERWYEPPDSNQVHLSTLLHQILAIIAQWGSIRVDQLYLLTCQQGSFKNISTDHFKELLSQMGKCLLIQQLSSGELVLGVKGEQVCGSYTFYSVFKTQEEFRIVSDNKTLGSLPIGSFVLKDQNLVFAGRRWKVLDIDDSRKSIYVVPATTGGNPPRFFNGNGLSIHGRVRQEMLNIYRAGDYKIEVNGEKIDFVDEVGRQLFDEGKNFFNHAKLDKSVFFQDGANCYVFPWAGDKVVNTLNILLEKNGFACTVSSGVIKVRNTDSVKIKKHLAKMLKDGLPTETELAQFVPRQIKIIEKFDDYLSDNLLNISYGQRAFNAISTKLWILNNAASDNETNNP